MGKVEMTLDFTDAIAELGEVKAAAMNPAILPEHARRELASLLRDLDIVGGLDKWYDTTSAAGQLEFRPTARMTALLAAIRRRRPVRDI